MGRFLRICTRDLSLTIFYKKENDQRRKVIDGEKKIKTKDKMQVIKKNKVYVIDQCSQVACDT